MEWRQTALEKGFQIQTAETRIVNCGMTRRKPAFHKQTMRKISSCHRQAPGFAGGSLPITFAEKQSPSSDMAGCQWTSFINGGISWTVK
jgi:hypothetical protein